MIWIAWYIIGLLDNIGKCFKYAWFFFIPVILGIIFLIIIKKKKYKDDAIKSKIISTIITILIILMIIGILTVRSWGPNYHKKSIKEDICGKEELVEQKLEAKYGKNFNYVSQSDIIMEKYAGSALLEDIDNDYTVKYTFKDDDGVLAIVEYKKKRQSDFYESKRSKYDIEQKIYNYAKQVGFNKKFYVYLESPSELISDSNLNEKVEYTTKFKKYSRNRIIFILTEKSYENRRFIIPALKEFVDTDDIFYVQEYILTENEYERAVNFYNSISSMNGIASIDYKESFDFDDESKLDFSYYYIN